MGSGHWYDPPTFIKIIFEFQLSLDKMNNNCSHNEFRKTFDYDLDEYIFVCIQCKQQVDRHPGFLDIFKSLYYLFQYSH